MFCVNEEWAKLPWNYFNSVEEHFAKLPTFVVAQCVFFLLTLGAALHARANGSRHMFVFVAALIAGTANDAFFMFLPTVDNFWQAQGLVNLTPRMPLYIPLVYICFMYIATVSVWRLGLPLLAEAALTGIAAQLIYAPYDILGAKFLWWTWHDTDASIGERLLGVPLGSTIWVITFSSIFSLLLRLTVGKWNSDEAEEAERGGSCKDCMGTYVKSLLVTASLATPLMMVLMTIFQLACGCSGRPNLNMLLLVLAVYSAIIVTQFRRDTGRATHGRRDALLLSFLVVYYVTLYAIVVKGDPTTHVSTSLHQSIGPCDVTALDLAGLERHVYLCPTNYSEDWNLAADALTLDPSSTDTLSWYTVTGRAHSNKSLWVSAVVSLSATSLTLYAAMLANVRR